MYRMEWIPPTVMDLPLQQLNLIFSSALHCGDVRKVEIPFLYQRKTQNEQSKKISLFHIGCEICLLVHKSPLGQGGDN